MAGRTGLLLRAAQASFPGWRPGALKLKARFAAAARAHGTDLAPFQAPQGTLAAMLAYRPQMLGALIWPYQCAGWEAPERLRRLAGHYAVLDTLGPPLTFAPDEKLPLADLSALYPELRLVLDQPKWFMREGGMVVNLFVGDFRAFSLAWSYYEPSPGQLQAVVGSLQGRNDDRALDLYRELTRALHGLRPRDALFEVFRMICRQTGVTDILAVSQAHRHHQHPFFGTKLASQALAPDYDAIWEDRGGERVDERLWRFPVDPPPRDLETIKPKKRSLYRKRFAFLDALEAEIVESWPTLTPTRFTDT